MLLEDIVAKDTMLAPPGGAIKRKTDQDQELQIKQHKSNTSNTSNIACNTSNIACNISSNQQSFRRRQPKMYYNSNSRPFWVKIRSPAAIIQTTTTTQTTTTNPTTTIIFNQQPATTLAYDKMQRCSPNNNSNNSHTTNNNNTSNNNTNNNSGNNTNNNGKRSSQKYTGNLGTGNNGMMSYQQHATSAATNGNGSNNKHATRKSRYNNNKQHHHQQQQQQQQQQQHHRQEQSGVGYGNLNLQKRNPGAGTGSESSPSPPWLDRGYGHRLVNSSCIEDKFLGQHNPGHRNSTSSEATSEDIDSSREHLNKPKGNQITGGHVAGSNSISLPAGGGNKSRPKRQPKASSQPKQDGVQQSHPGKALVHNGKAKQQQQQPGNPGNPGKSWRQQNGNSGNPVNTGNHQNQQPAKRNGGNKKCGAKVQNNGGGNKQNNHHHHRNGSIIMRSNCDSSSSSALSSPTSSPDGKRGLERSLMPGSATLDWRRGRQNVNFLVPPLRQYLDLELDDLSMVQLLRRHVIDHHLLRVYGFPVESVVHEGAIEIFKCLPHMSFAAALAETAPAMTVINYHDGLAGIRESPVTSSDSGNSSPRSLDSESGGEWSGSECESSSSSSSGSSASSSAAARDLSLELKYCQYVQVERSLTKPCARCKRHFLVDELTGEYLTSEECQYHSGKYQRYYDGVCMGRWSCCHATDESSPGCCHGERHVWTGSVIGVNGPYHDFVRTQPRRRRSRHQLEQQQQQQHRPSVYALDCEMSYTGRGLDVTKVSLVSLNGQLVYEHFVRPDCDIIDYNTRYSGITEWDLRSGGGAKCLAEVQRDLLELIAEDTILIGHGLDNDLRALRIVHTTLIDTSITFPHCSGFPYRRALRHLTKVHLKREIQCGDGTTGHSSFEDSRACMELMLWRINRELDPTWSWDD
ncbi:hypothetical protein KR009_006399 [Drosophila setifemur]|nr:hypothetical protein KR009_006399 [Drosophila setifemur]